MYLTAKDSKLTLHSKRKSGILNMSRQTKTNSNSEGLKVLSYAVTQKKNGVDLTCTSLALALFFCRIDISLIRMTS